MIATRRPCESYMPLPELPCSVGALWSTLLRSEPSRSTTSPHDHEGSGNAVEPQTTSATLGVPQVLAGFMSDKGVSSLRRARSLSSDQRSTWAIRMSSSDGPAAISAASHDTTCAAVRTRLLDIRTPEPTYSL